MVGHAHGKAVALVATQQRQHARMGRQYKANRRGPCGAQMLAHVFRLPLQQRFKLRQVIADGDKAFVLRAFFQAQNGAQGVRVAGGCADAVAGFGGVGD